ncbi:hypothetical protein B0F90DRAFT_1787820 [Multifurca ochricompacta]|uniref:Uncharacterized protein n=1 Tax=Multifurca ochricompacta TaxID=376703 RepID=A0AAD4QIT6_9AGAM|nr:hypothetical protein B0F90DRAFT_1787820 [Multifurca ochricompacta]
MLFGETLAMDTTSVSLLCSSDLLGANIFCFFFHFGISTNSVFSTTPRTPVVYVPFSLICISINIIIDLYF